MPFPSLIAELPAYDGPFDAFRLDAAGCAVLFATYPSGTVIAAHSHVTHNVGVIVEGELILTTDEVRRYGVGDWYELAPGVEHAAAFDVPTTEIEFWFDAGSRPGRLGDQAWST